MDEKPVITVIGAGLAGCEAAWQAARLGVRVRLYEMKPHKRTPAHSYDGMAELVCSNSLRSDSLSNAIGLLKAELTQLGSLVMRSAHENKIPAGGALAVDRQGFSDYITNEIRNNSFIDIIEKEVYNVNSDEITVVATGPLTSAPMAEYITSLFGDGLHFFDAAAPIVDFDSIDKVKVFFASRYDKGDADYINCPMTKEEYDAFYDALVSARTAVLHDFDKEEQQDLTVFEGCMPVEIMAKRGRDTLCYGPLKPVGLKDPKTGREPYAVVQLRRDNTAGSMYNIVGFQTHLAFDEQKRVFGMIPGLENAEFLRYGVMHRNTYINSPKYLDGVYSVKTNRNLFFAGQMTGVEGYIESASSGLVAGVNAARRALGREDVIFPPNTATGALSRYISSYAGGDFQPMNVNFGIIDPLTEKVKGGKRIRNEKISERALGAISEISAELEKERLK